MEERSHPKSWEVYKQTLMALDKEENKKVLLERQEKKRQKKLARERAAAEKAAADELDLSSSSWERATVENRYANGQPWARGSRENLPAEIEAKVRENPNWKLATARAAQMTSGFEALLKEEEERRQRISSDPGRRVQQHRLSSGQVQREMVGTAGARVAEETMHLKLEEQQAASEARAIKEKEMAEAHVAEETMRVQFMEEKQAASKARFIAEQELAEAHAAAP